MENKILFKSLIIGNTSFKQGMGSLSDIFERDIVATNTLFERDVGATNTLFERDVGAMNTLFKQDEGLMNTIDPIYVPRLGIFKNIHDNHVLYKLPEIEMTKYFRFRIEFDKYQYTMIYLPQTNAYRNILSGRKYNIYLCLDINLIKKQNNMLPELNRKLTYYLSLLQIREIKNKKTYRCSKDKLTKYVEYHYTKYLYMVPWYYYHINDNYIYNLKTKSMVNLTMVGKIWFKKKGCIIETNSVRKIIHDYFFARISIPTIVVLPSNMTNLWTNESVQGEFIIITYDQLPHLTMDYITTIADSGIKQLIIHECHQTYLTSIKKLISITGCEYIWVINSLRLCFYCPTGLNINNIASICNLWLCYTNDEKKRYKTEIIHMITTRLSHIYHIVNYGTSINDSVIRLKASPYETYIHTILDHFYTNWKCKLSNDGANRYSVSNITKNRKIERRLHNAFIAIILSVIDNDHVYDFFVDKISNVLQKTSVVTAKFDLQLHKYNEINKACNYAITNQIIDFSHITEGLANKRHKASIQLANYRRYQVGSVYCMINDSICPICYCNPDGSFNSSLVKFICGHSVCIECSINTIAKFSKCPICNEFINICKITIIKDTITDYHSDIIQYIKNLGSTHAILTNLNATHAIRFHLNGAIVVDIDKINIDQLNVLESMTFIAIIMTPISITNDSLLSKLNMVTGYLASLNTSPAITQVEIDI